ncbi:hypothetical protein [Fluviicola sp.]|uniref:hypothetical protein n=1 Tax=Fluviicola sp. TaxID=1917219 RepID=UPI002607B039|nr:hypothetical protein [Fluviicola sp.]
MKKIIGILLLGLLSSCDFGAKEKQLYEVKIEKNKGLFLEHIIKDVQTKKVLFSLKYDAIENKITIKRREFLDVGVEVSKVFEQDSTSFRIQLHYFKKKNFKFNKSISVSGIKGKFKDFYYSDEPNRNLSHDYNDVHLSFTFMRYKGFDKYDLVGEFFDDYETIEELNELIFDGVEGDIYLFNGSIKD